MEELNNITIILVRPKYAENIGSAARAALNMGFSNLCIVGVKTINLDAAKKTATHNAAHILESAKFAANISEVLADYSLLVGTSARIGRSRRPTSLPDQLAGHLLPYCHSGKVGLVFGPENKGLENEELKHCGILTAIPTAEFSSLNLAQSVAILCYEIRKGFLANKNISPTFKQPLAAKEQELASMYVEVSQLLKSLDSLSGQTKAGIYLKHLHQLLSRAIINSKEAKLLKNACQNITATLKNSKTTTL